MMRTILLLILTLSLTASCRSGKKKPHVPKGDAELTNTYWRLAEMNGKAVETPADARDVFIRLITKRGKLEGFTGCNMIEGTHSEGRKGAIEFKAMTTLMACEERTDVEQYVLRALSKANRYLINDKHLLLYNDNYLLAIFEARYYK
jgi:heat shock protein HslJ